MKRTRMLIICGLMLPAAGAWSAASEIPLQSHGYAGYTYRSVTKDDVSSMESGDIGGVVVTKILPDSPAKRAGIREGDVIKKYNEHPIPDSVRFADVNRLFYAGDDIKVTALRNGQPLILNLTLGTFPQEKSTDVKIEYTSFQHKGILFRAVITSPPDSGGGKLPALLMVSALGGPRLIDVPSYNMSREIAHLLSKNGFRVMRFELRGSGDSQGEDYRTTDFWTEVGDNEAALDYLMNRDDVDKDKVFVFGHSTGGEIAAILAGRRKTAGLIASCTVGRTFYERLAETVRLQSALGGDSYAVTDGKIRDYLFLTVSIARGEPLGGIIAKNPELSRFVNSSNRIMDDRTGEYWRQELNLNMAEIYGKIAQPALIIYAGSDFLTQAECHKHIAEILSASGNKDATLKIIPDMDHKYAFAGDKKESFENYKTGNFKENPAGKGAMLDWLQKHVLEEKSSCRSLLAVTPEVERYALDISSGFKEGATLESKLRHIIGYIHGENGLNPRLFSPDKFFALHYALKGKKLKDIYSAKEIAGFKDMSPAALEGYRELYNKYMVPDLKGIMFGPEAADLIKHRMAFGCTHYARAFIAVVRALRLVPPSDIRYVVSSAHKDYGTACASAGAVWDGKFTINGHQFVLIRYDGQWKLLNTSDKEFEIVPAPPALWDYALQNVTAEFPSYAERREMGHNHLLVRYIGNDYADGVCDNSFGNLMRISVSGSSNDGKCAWKPYAPPEKAEK